MTINGIYSQKKYITETERDSIYAKIIRGKYNGERVLLLNKTIEKYDSILNLKNAIILNNEKATNELFLVIENQNKIIDNNNLLLKEKEKECRRKKINKFINGVLLGTLATSLIIIL